MGFSVKIRWARGSECSHNTPLRAALPAELPPCVPAHAGYRADTDNTFQVLSGAPSKYPFLYLN